MKNNNDKNLAPIKGRIVQFVEKQHIEKKSFFNSLGVASSNFRGNALFSEVSADVVAKILSQYRDVNIDWLLSGEGEMFKGSSKGSISQNITGDGNIQSGNDTTVADNSKQLVQELQKQLEECKEQLKEKDKTISQLVNLMSSK